MKRLAAGLAVVGAIVTSLAAAAPWGHLGTSPPPPLPPSTTSVQGLDVAPGIRVLALVAVAAAVAALAVRGWGRRVIGLVILGCGVGIVVQAVERKGAAALTELLVSSGPVVVDPTLWPWAAALGGVLVCASGLLVVLRGPTWSAMSSDYQPPAAREPDPVSHKGAWDAMDRGEDPTH